jgi:hypothetical protein
MPTEQVHSQGSVLAPEIDDVRVPRQGWLMIQDWIEALPRPWRIFQPLGFFLLGIAATALFAWREADVENDIRYYKMLTIVLAVAGAIAILADFAIRRETKRPVGTILDYCDSVNKSLGINRPRNQRSLWKRIRPDKEQPSAPK